MSPRASPPAPQGLALTVSAPSDEARTPAGRRPFSGVIFLWAIPAWRTRQGRTHAVGREVERRRNTREFHQGTAIDQALRDLDQGLVECLCSAPPEQGGHWVALGVAELDILADWEAKERLFQRRAFWGQPEDVVEDAEPSRETAAEAFESLKSARRAGLRLVDED